MLYDSAGIAASMIKSWYWLLFWRELSVVKFERFQCCHGDIWLSSNIHTEDNQYSVCLCDDGMERGTQTQDIFSLADAAWKHPKYPCFCILPLEFEVNIDIHKHENSEVIYSNRNKFPKEMSGNLRLQKTRKTC